MPEIMGSMPTGVVIEDTQLRSLEARAVNCVLPTKIEGRVRKVAIMLRFYDVEDQYQGNLEKTHWTSEPLATAELEVRQTPPTIERAYNQDRRGCTMAFEDSGAATFYGQLIPHGS